MGSCDLAASHNEILKVCAADSWHPPKPLKTIDENGSEREMASGCLFMRDARKQKCGPVPQRNTAGNKSCFMIFHLTVTHCWTSSIWCLPYGLPIFRLCVWPSSLFCYFVLMTFSFFGMCTKLFAYAFGMILRSFGSCTKYSYPCFCANRIASSFDLKFRWVPCVKSAEDCHPINGFSHR